MVRIIQVPSPSMSDQWKIGVALAHQHDLIDGKSLTGQVGQHTTDQLLFLRVGSVEVNLERAQPGTQHRHRHACDFRPALRVIALTPGGSALTGLGRGNLRMLLRTHALTAREIARTGELYRSLIVDRIDLIFDGQTLAHIRIVVSEPARPKRFRRRVSTNRRLSGPASHPVSCLPVVGLQG